MMKITSVCALLVLFANTAMAAGDIAAGKTKSATCAACHGPDGNSTNPAWPSLAGQHAEYTKKQLMDFKSGARNNAQMSPMAAPLSEQDMDDLAAYYASQKPATAAAKDEDIDLGQRLYRAGDAEKGLAACMACHGPNGIGNPASSYPRINGQHAAYTAAQLKAFRAEERADEVMRDIAARMTNEEIDAVSNYIQGLH